MNMQKCAFCGRSIDQVVQMVKSPLNHNIYICDKCVETTVAVFNGKINNKSACDLRQHWRNAKNMEILKKKSKWNDAIFDLTPSQIHMELDRFIIGQEHAKKVLSVAVYNHNKRLHDSTGLIKKSNILLAGPSGCGKTLLTKTLAKILNVPFTVVDATGMTEAGYIGDNVEICLQRLLQMTGGDIELAQKGIVYIDELDKIARVGGKQNHTRDVSGEGVQAALLKLIDGTTISVPVNFEKESFHSEAIMFDTTNVLFVCGGAFEGLFDSETKKAIGFSTTNQPKGAGTDKEANEMLTPEALKKYGIMPELTGRLPVLCALTDLTEKELIQVLTEPEDAITKEYQMLFSKEDVELVYETEALYEIAKLAIQKKTGARGLRAIMEEVMLNIMYDIPDQKNTISKCIITKECIQTKQPIIVKKRQKKKKIATI